MLFYTYEIEMGEGEDGGGWIPIHPRWTCYVLCEACHFWSGAPGSLMGDYKEKNHQIKGSRSGVVRYPNVLGLSANVHAFFHCKPKP